MESAAHRAGTSSGGPMVSAAKRKRLAALNEALLGTNRRRDARPGSSLKTSRPLNQAAGSQNIRPGVVSVNPGASAEFPYNTLGEAMLDGSLSAALAQAKSASTAASNALNVSTSSIPTALHNPPSKAGPSAPPSCRITGSAVAAALTAAGAGGDSVAAEVLAQLVTTNPRASASDLRNLLSQRLQDRSVMLENPVAPLKASKLFARDTSKFSTKLRSSADHKNSKAQREPATKRTPSYETMLRVHELWQQYAQSQASAGSVGGSGAAPATSNGPLGRDIELHGAMLTVVKHVNPQHVGAVGIVLRQSNTSLHLVTPGDRVRVVPLKGCTGQYTVNGTTVQLNG